MTVSTADKLNYLIGCKWVIENLISYVLVTSRGGYMLSDDASVLYQTNIANIKLKEKHRTY